MHYNHRSRERGTPHPAGPCEEYQVWVQVAEDRSQGKPLEALLRFLGKARRGRVGQASVNNFKRLQAFRVSPLAWHFPLGQLRQKNISSWVQGPDKGGRALEWLVCIAKACALLGPLLSLKIG